MSAMANLADQEGRARTTFRAMGTEICVYGPEHPAFQAATASVRLTFEREERRFSRFRGDSELTQVNRAAGRWTAVSDGFETLVRFALEQAEATQGLFDPTVLHAVIAAGYDRDFDEIVAGARGALNPPAPCARAAEVGIRQGWLRLPGDLGLDLGGIAKGWTVDLAMEDALRAGLPWVLVSAGGDLRIGGKAPVLEIAVEDPDDLEGAAALLRLDRGALATSTVAKRAWGPGLHHVIDPRTGAPAETDAVQATVWATTCSEAEVLATWALLTGPPAAREVPCAMLTIGDDLLVSFPTDEAAAA